MPSQHVPLHHWQAKGKEFANPYEYFSSGQSRFTPFFTAVLYARLKKHADQTVFLYDIASGGGKHNLSQN